MIQKPSTSEVMKVFTDANNMASDIKTSVDNIKTVIEKRLKIINTELEYQQQQALNLGAEPEASSSIKEKIILSTAEKFGGLYDIFGITIHPKFKNTPTNIFNFKSTTEYLFKNNATVTINDVADPEMSTMLQHDSIEGKDYIIKEYDSPDLTMTLQVDDSKSLGDLKFNAIEMVPFLSGSFNVQSIDIYDTNSITPNHCLANLKNVAAERLFLDSKVTFNKVVFTIKLLYKDSNNKYPFGFKHLYFLNANLTDDCYAIFRVTKDKNISYIYNNILVKNQFGIYVDYTTDVFGIEFYSTLTNGVLSHQIEVSTDTNINYVAVNTKTCYIKIPISTSIISVIPDIITADK